jgi:hypothetical protein
MGVTDGTWGLVIPGSGRLGADGIYRIGPRAHACLREAARLAERRRPRVVVFTGWSPVGGRSEAEQMLDAWEGSEGIELVAEPTAAITAQNMSRSLPHLLERGVREVTVVCGLLHLPRVRYHFGGVYPRHGVSCSYARVRQLPTPSGLAWEAAAAVVMRRQRREALAEIAALAHGASRPDSPLPG